ncbi:MAG: hypothetical protein AAF725_13320, partial [Acidobacteriota bacterium]
ETARTRLELARGRCPNDPALDFAAARIADGLGEPLESARIQPAGEPRSLGDTPRSRFNQWPIELYARHARWLEGRAEAQREALGALLDEIEEARR